MKVVDASVWVSRLVPQDVHHSISRRWLEQYAAAEGLFARLIPRAITFSAVQGRATCHTNQRLSKRSLID